MISTRNLNYYLYECERCKKVFRFNDLKIILKTLYKRICLKKMYNYFILKYHNRLFFLKKIHIIFVKILKMLILYQINRLDIFNFQQ